MTALKREVYFVEETNRQRHMINLKNGMFDTRKMELLPHAPEFYSTIQVPIDYKPDIGCPRFMQFIGEVFEGDQERIAVAQEWAGYLLTPETKAQKSLILFGSGANGKGVFTDILCELIGEENISHISLNELDRSFSRVRLYNKAANICSENETDGKAFNTQYFKAIVGEDPIEAEEKNKPMFSFKPMVKFVFAMNNLPQTKDRSDGFYRRLMILNFSAHFTEEQRDRDLKKKLKEELSGIFLWAMEGLKRLRENGFQFSRCGDMENSLADYRTEQNPLLDFFHECISAEPGHREDSNVIYSKFQTWALENGHSGYSNIGNRRFWREFESVAKSLGIQTQSGHTGNVRYRAGIKLVGECNQLIGRRPPLKPPFKGSLFGG